MCIILCSFRLWLDVCVLLYRREDGNNTCESSVLSGPIVEIISELVKQMKRPHWEILCWTPFTHFMDIALVLQEREVLDVLLLVYDDRSQRFKIGESILSFKAEDVTLILGLHCDVNIISFKNQRLQSNFEKTFLHKMYNHHREVIKDNLFRLVHRQRQWVEDLCKAPRGVLYDYDLVPQYFSKCPTIRSKVRWWSGLARPLRLGSCYSQVANDRCHYNNRVFPIAV